MKRKTKSLVWGTILALGIVTLPLNTYGEEFTSSAEAGFTSEDMTTSEEAPATEENVLAGTDEGNEQTEETVENEKTEEPASGEEVNLKEENSEDQGFFGTEENVDNSIAFSSEEHAENQVFFGDAERLDDEIAAVGASGTGFDGAKTIYTNTMYSTNFTDSIRERWLEFTVTGDGYISLDFSHEYLESGNIYWWATIYTDGSHNQLASYGFAGNNVSYSLQKFGISAGTYYLKINADYFSDVKFKFKLNYEVADNWESEVNDTYQHADLISCNKQYNGSFQRNGDIDWYKFEILQNGSVSIDFEHDYIENDKVFWYFELYNEDFNCLNYGSIQGTYTRYSGSTCGIPAGTYFLKIQKGDRYEYSDFVYRLKINYTSSSVWEKEVNDSYWRANPINLNTLYYGALLRCNEADVDWYKFISPAEGKYEFYFGHEYVESDSNLWIAEIYEGSSFNKINTFFYAGNKKNSSNDISLSGGKIYYIKILNPRYYWTDANYSLKVVSHVTVKEGWVKSESNWQYRLSTGEFVTDNWKKIGNNWYHFDEEGYMQTGWLKIGNTWYYLKSDGVMAKDEWVENSKYYIDASGKYVPEKKKYAAGWKKNSKGYWYQNSDGSYPKNQWKSISGSWYHFDSKGYMQTGWLRLGNTWYYLKPNGMMAKNEWVENGKYYIDANGKYVPGKTKYAAGWKKNSKGWWYQNSDGSYPKNQWKSISGSWYHFDSKGYMQTGWLKLGNTWYYLKPNGMMAKNEWVENGKYYIDANGKYVPGKTKYAAGWKKNSKGYRYQNSDGSYPKNQWKNISGSWYHFDAEGYMQTGWIKLGNTWYYLKTNGMMASNTWVGNYYVNNSGVWCYTKSKDIPKNAVEYNGHYYYLYFDSDVNSYEKALEFCKKKGGYLATLTSKKENDFVFSYMKKCGYDSAYFGLSDAKVEGFWKWCNGEKVSYTNWHSGEPNGENSREDYAMFYYKYNDGTWNDGDFGGSTANGGTAFICEWGYYEK